MWRTWLYPSGKFKSTLEWSCYVSDLFCPSTHIKISTGSQNTVLQFSFQNYLMSQNKSPLLFYSFVYGKQYYIIHHYTYENTSMFYLQILTTKPPSQFSFLRQTTEKTSFHVGYLELFVKKIILFYFQKTPEKLPSTLKKKKKSCFWSHQILWDLACFITRTSARSV